MHVDMITLSMSDNNVIPFLVGAITMQYR